MEKEVMTEIRMTLETDQDMNFNKGSLLHGVLMERVSSEYAESVHREGLRTYSQCIRKENGKDVWYVRTFSAEAHSNIIAALADETFDKFVFRYNDKEVRIIEKDIRQIDKKSLFEDFYAKDSSRVCKIEFTTPTSFKKNGGYYNYPDISNIYSSLMKKYDASSGESVLSDDETLEHLVDNTEILSYSLYSTKFSLEGVKIPAFMGNIVVKIKGPQTMVNFANLLFKFGEFSGVGIKTAIGMGSIKITEKGR